MKEKHEEKRKIATYRVQLCDINLLDQDFCNSVVVLDLSVGDLSSYQNPIVRERLEAGLSPCHRQDSLGLGVP